jgi:hypothetical protein
MCHAWYTRADIPSSVFLIIVHLMCLAFCLLLADLFAITKAEIDKR